MYPVCYINHLNYMKYNRTSFHLVKILGKYFSLAKNGQTTYQFHD